MVDYFFFIHHCLNCALDIESIQYIFTVRQETPQPREVSAKDGGDEKVEWIMLITDQFKKGYWFPTQPNQPGTLGALGGKWQCGNVSEPKSSSYTIKSVNFGAQDSTVAKSLF